MKYIKSFEAFTLLEMMIALVLSSIVFSMSFMCYSVVFKQFKNYKMITGAVNETDQLNVALQTDFFSASHIYDKEGGIDFEFEDRPDVRYSFFESMITRETNDRLDSFTVSVSDIEKKSHADQAGMNRLVYQMLFKIRINENTEVFRFDKKYSSADQMFFTEPASR